MSYSADPQAYWQRRGETYMDEEAEIRGPASVTEQQAHYLVALLRGRPILEVGCGYGRLLRELARLRPTWEFTGVDFAPSQLCAAREYLGLLLNAVVYEAAAHLLPFLSDRFDTVYTAGCCMHIPPAGLGPVQRELTRVARRRIVHVEATQGADDYIVAHDYRAGYAALGWGEVLAEPAPYQLPGQSLLVQVFEPPAAWQWPG